MTVTDPPPSERRYPGPAMTLDEALAYDAGPRGDLACEHWCASAGHGSCCHGSCDCGMERARAVVATLQAAVTAREGPPMR